ncbi:MAG: VOC family protein [Pseudomonadales bacterium]|nr:VOC family protein [Pseudomonadales bacterium]
MTIQLRQICLVAAELEPVVQDLTDILGIERCYVDPGVGQFGLENTLMPIGYNFLEVVAPVEDNTAAGRYLQRRQGDGGYMVITQADSKATQLQVRQNAQDNDVRVAFESERGDWHLIQLHPRDMVAAFLEIESDAHNDFTGHWHPVGGTGWEDKVKQDVTVDIIGVELQAADPHALADLWSRVTGLPVEGDDTPMIRLNNATLRFVEETDGRGPGLGGLDIAVANPGHIRERAEARGKLISEDRVDICGVRWYLHDA